MRLAVGLTAARPPGATDPVAPDPRRPGQNQEPHIAIRCDDTTCAASGDVGGDERNDDELITATEGHFADLLH